MACSVSFVVDLFLQRKRMLFMGSLCREMSLKFLCTSLVWGRWVTLAVFDDIILLLRPFLLAGWLTSACAAEPLHYTLTLPTYCKHILTAFHWEFFKRALVCSFQLSQHAHTFLSPPLYFPRRSASSCNLLDSACRDFRATCNFLLWATDTSWVFFSFLLYFFHVPPPPSSLSKSVLKPVKGLMRLEFIRHWVGSAPRSFTPCLKVLSQREFLGLFMMF